MSTITCPHCHKELEITEALKHQIEEQVLSSMQEAHQKELQELKKQAEKDQEEMRSKVAYTIRKELEEKSSLEFEDLKKQLQEKDKRVQEFRELELKMREERRKLEEKEKELELSVSRRIDEEKKKIEEDTLRKSSEEHRLKEKEKEKVIDDLKKQLDDALRKANQGSQQLQGEILELDLEMMLKEAFPHDDIEPVGKGVMGSDIRQVVKSPRGTICGSILWECKRTKNWSDGWISKLKEDLRNDKANLSVIVSTCFPKEMTSDMGLKDGVWVSSYALVLPLAMLLRKSLLDVGYQKALAMHRGEKADVLFEYITGHEFRNQVESIVEVYTEMKQQVTRERAAFEKIWKQREMQANRLLTSSSTIYGSIQGIAGSSLPSLKGLDLAELEDGN